MISDIPKSDEANTNGGPPVNPPIHRHCDVTDLSTLEHVSLEIFKSHEVVHILVNNSAAVGSKTRLGSFYVVDGSWRSDL